jgi:hypothetical protein
MTIKFHKSEVSITPTQESLLSHLRTCQSDDQDQTKATSPPQLQDGVVRSEKGVPIIVRRYQTPDGPLGLMTLEISYGDRRHSRHAGRQVWHSDTPRGWRLALEILDHFLHDRDSIGNAFRNIQKGDKNL